MKIGFVGLGHLGKDAAEVIAEHHDVIGYDIREDIDVGVTVSSSLEFAVKDKDVVFVAVPTPHDPLYDGKEPTSHLPPKDFDYSIAKEVIAEVDSYVNSNTLIVLISTVLPGTVRREILPLIKNGRFIYNPYLIAQGTVKHDMRNPEMLIIGTNEGEQSNDAMLLLELYKPMLEQKVKRAAIGTYEEAESIKIFYNTFISSKIALVNMIQDVANGIGNMNAEVVCDALANSTMRIMSSKYMKPGFGDGGGCHPRDNIALRSLAKRLNLGYDLFDAIMKAREEQAANMARECLSHGNDVIILGKGFKPGIDQEAGSPSMLVGWYIEKLDGFHRVYYDMVPDPNEKYTYLIHDNTKEYKFNKGSVVIDPYRKLAKSPDYTVIHYGNTRTK
jgi:UDPglucose 6-dehydrogenase